MSGKNQFPNTFNWQSTNPSTNFLPNPNQPGSTPSGNASGAMAATNTIYSQIIDVSKMDNIGLDVNWTGSPVGVFQVMYSNTGQNFKAITFTPPIIQPAGTAAGLGVDLNQFPWKFLMLQYTNTSGAGTLMVNGQMRDLN